MIDTLLFWMDGVVTTPLADITIHQLESVLNDRLGIAERLEIRDWALELQLGRIDSVTFCNKSLAITQAPLAEKELAARIGKNVAPIPGVLDVVRELIGTYGLWLIAHCPREWLLSISERLDLVHLFTGHSILFCPESGLSRLLPDVFYLAAQQAGKPLENCLLVAGDSAITTAAVNVGLNAIIFADARRLRRELGLRQLLPAV